MVLLKPSLFWHSARECVGPALSAPGNSFWKLPDPLLGKFGGSVTAVASWRLTT